MYIFSKKIIAFLLIITVTSLRVAVPSPSRGENGKEGGGVRLRVG